MGDKKWYVVHTYSGHENRAKQLLEERIRANHLEDKFGEVLVPTEDVVEVKQGSKRTSSRKFFPGYMLVKMELDDETMHLVKNTQKITGFVGAGARPSPVPEAEVLRIRGQMEEGAAAPKTVQSFEDGANVRVIGGPFVNFNGVVEEVRPERQKLWVMVSIFGRATRVELDFTQVEPL
jgi:transcriptional antiterminator NusG